MNPKQILEMITANRRFIKLRSNIALQNLAMLHKSFDAVDDEECQLALTLNDCDAAIVFSSDYARAISISEAIMERYPESPYQHLIASHKCLTGRCYIFQTSYDISRVYLQSAEEISYALPSDDEEVRGLRADILSNQAMNGYHTGMSAEAMIGYLDRALQELEGTSMSNRKGVCLMGIANVFSQLERHEDCIAYHKKALPLFEEAENFTNIATVSINMGAAYVRLGRFDLGETCLMRGLDLRSRLGTYWEIGNVYYNLALLYETRGDHEDAYRTMLIARDYALVSQARGVQVMILQKLAEMARTRGDQASEGVHLSRLTEVETAVAA